MQIIGYAVVSSLFVGIARAWELVGDRDTGIRASIAVLAGRIPGPEPAPAAGAADAPEATGVGRASASARESNAHHGGERAESAPVTSPDSAADRVRRPSRPSD